MKRAAAAFLFVLLGIALLRPGMRPSPPAPVPPAPTEHRLSEGAEEENKIARKRWFEEMHRAAPGTDWRAIERANGRELQDLRNRSVPKRLPEWTELGSRNLAGRMHAAALSVSGDSLYGGSSLGGVWKGSLHGEGWRPLSDNLYGGAHGLAAADGPPEVVTAVTDGGLIHYTEDGGATWIVPSGPEPDLSECKRVLRDYGTSDRIYLVTRVSVTSGKVWRSDDGGRTYTRIARLAADPGDIWLDRVSGGDLYLQKGERTLRSGDGGATWDTLGVLPVANPTGVVLTGSEAGAPTLYCAAAGAAGWGLYRSTDGGLTWAYRHEIHDFWETLCASITDWEKVFFAGVELWLSVDGGGSFTKYNDWWAYYDDPVHKFHADFPGGACVWVPGEGEVFYVATDGGLYRSGDGLASITNISLEYLGVSQYYTTLTSGNDPDLILAGAQDQGYQRSTGTAIGSWRDFDQLWSGDYGHLTSGDGTHENVYSVYPGFVLRHQGEANPVLSSHDFPAGELYNAWMPYVLADPLESNKMYFCASRLYTYRFLLHGPVVTASNQDFTVNGSAFLSCFSISPVDPDRWIAATNAGEVWYSTDHGANWSPSPDPGPSQTFLYGTAVAFSPIEGGAASLGGSGYSGPAVYSTADGGVTWVPDSDGLPFTLVYDLAFEETGTDALYAATEAGPYRRDPASRRWSYIGGTEAPMTTYWSVEAVPAAGVMRFGTYGRGIWDYAYDAATSAAEGPAPLPEARGLLNFPNPFNPSTTIRYRLDEADDMTLAVYNAAGRRVRLLESGFRGAGEHETVWDGRSERGNDVASGVYTARLETKGRATSRRMVLAR
ncbi:MAG: FlgD immunoglobulin-like domain containing protein [Candidatus Eisenbacteria bacterium]